MNNGIYFTKIAALDKEKSIAELDLNIGLNLITGASNTGKSYIIDCLDFILGSKQSPKNIIEAEGYNRIRAEIRTFDGRIFTLSRQFGQSVISVAECQFHEFDSKYPKLLSTIHSDKNENNLSYFLLSLIKLEGKKLKKNNRNVIKSLSFRDLAKFCLVSETKIIEIDSPIYSGQNTEKTSNKALFKLLLTGKDDDELEEIENPEIKKSKINGKIELIKEEIESKRKFLKETKDGLYDLSDEEINIQIEKLIQTVEGAHQELLDEEKKRAKIWSELDELMSKKSQNEGIIKRFELLNQHYLSDLNRLEFIYEGTQGLVQLADVNCPLCNSLINQKILEPYTNEEDIMISIKEEFLKIEKKNEQLLETTTQIMETIDELILQIVIKKEEYQNIDKYISEKLKPVYKIHSADLNKFLTLRDAKAQIRLVEEQIIELRKSLAYYYEKLREKQELAPETVLSEIVYSELSNEIKNVLISWGIDCKEVYYDPQINDIEIDGEKRSNSGKGYRAIYLSGFMVGVLLFCLKRNLKHPNFLVLDSPLTQYKERDIEQEGGEIEERIPEEILNKFYKSLVTLPEINNIQIIVIENRDPPDKLKEKMNYIHFSRNQNIGRYGFYPV